VPGSSDIAPRIMKNIFPFRMGDLGVGGELVAMSEANPAI
jgi:hypothetical protein